MSQALAATQMALAREQQLSALGGVVAAAAHELGTPLATIKLVSTELVDELADQPHLQEDALLVRAQADRCSRHPARHGPARPATTRWSASPPSRAWSRRRPRRTPTAASASSPASRAPPLEDGPEVQPRWLAPAGDHPGPAQPGAERRRLRRHDRLDRPRLDRRRARVGDRRRRPGLSAGPDRPHRRPLRRAGARRRSPTSGPATRAWASASSSPRRCSSAPAPASRFGNGDAGRAARRAARIRPPDRRHRHRRLAARPCRAGRDAGPRGADAPGRARPGRGVAHAGRSLSHP